ncbi:MAG: hypothetical protein AB1728_12420 [Bacteroidota bacterium]
MSDGICIVPQKLQKSSKVLLQKETYFKGKKKNRRSEARYNPLTVLLNGSYDVLQFGGMLLSTRTGLGVFIKEPKFNRLTMLTFLFVTIGGMILGPLVLNYAFNE